MTIILELLPHPHLAGVESLSIVAVDWFGTGGPGGGEMGELEREGGGDGEGMRRGKEGGGKEGTIQ